MTVSQVQYQSLVQKQNPTQSDWDAIAVPVPASMMIIAADTGVVKIGDGTSAYTDLPVLFILGQATTQNPGLVTLATLEEALMGTASNLAISPATMGHYVNNAIGSLLVVSDGTNTINNPLRIIFTNGATVTPVVTTPPIIQEANSVGASISLPSPVTVGNTLVCLYDQNGGEPQVPAGWHGAASDTGSWQAMAAIYKPIETVDDGTLTINSNGSVMYMAEVAGGVSVTAYVGAAGYDNITMSTSTISVEAGSQILTIFSSQSQSVYGVPGPLPASIRHRASGTFGDSCCITATSPPESSGTYQATIQASGINTDRCGFGTVVIQPNTSSVSADINVTAGTMTFLGSYDTTGSTNYIPGNVVLFRSGAYVCVTPTTQSPSVAPIDWDVVCPPPAGASGISMTDGTLGLLNVTDVHLTNMELSTTYATPVVVQSAVGTGGTVTFQNPLTPGNFILLLSDGYDLGLGPQLVYPWIAEGPWDGSGTRPQAWGGIIQESDNLTPTWTYQGGNTAAVMVEFSSAVAVVSGTQTGEATSGGTSGAYTTTFNCPPANGGLTIIVTRVPGIVFSSPNNITYVNGGTSGQSNIGVYAVPNTGNAEVDIISNAGFGSPWGAYVALTLVGSNDGVAAVTPSIPVTLNGTVLGNAKTIALVTGSGSVGGSVDGLGNLTINLS